MTGFDFVVLSVLALSALIGFVRGATREVVTVTAFVLAVVAAVFLLRFTAPATRHFIHTLWLARVAALLAMFIITYIVLRLLGGSLIRGVRAGALSSLDRGLGAALGLARGVVVVGVLVLLIGAATPPERLPGWYRHARTYPLASAAGAMLRAFAPQGAHMAKAMAPAVENALAPTDNEAAGGGTEDQK
jgi:membrane protein required for colicin V production